MRPVSMSEKTARLVDRRPYAFAFGLSLVCQSGGIAAGRQLYLDGSTYVLRSLLGPSDTLWSHRRLFALVWDTAAAQLVGLLAPGRFETAAIMFGVAASIKLLFPVILMWQHEIEPTARHLLTVLYFASIMIFANFIVSEMLFTLALTTLFVVYTICPRADRHARRRFVLAGALLASYEAAVLSNTVLALASWLCSRAEPRSMQSRIALPLVLLAVLPYQIVWYFIEPGPTVAAAGDPFLLILCAALSLVVIATACSISVVRKRAGLRALIFSAAFILPLTTLFVPALLHLRSDILRFSYPARTFAVVMSCCIAALPLFLQHDGAFSLRRVLNFFGADALRDTALTLVLLFCGLNVVTAVDTYRFRAMLGEQLGALRGRISLAECSFCQAPEEYGVVDMQLPYIWESYSIAYSMTQSPQRTVVISASDRPLFDPLDVSKLLGARGEDGR